MVKMSEKEDWEIWERKAIPVLTKILEQNKDKIDDLEYRKFLGPTGDVPATVEYSVKRLEDGSYKIKSVHPVGIKRYVSTLPLYSEKGYTLGELASKIVEDISNNDFRNEFVQNLEKRTGVNLEEEIKRIEKSH